MCHRCHKSDKRCRCFFNLKFQRNFCPWEAEIQTENNGNLDHFWTVKDLKNTVFNRTYITTVFSGFENIAVFYKAIAKVGRVMLINGLLENIIANI